MDFVFVHFNAEHYRNVVKQFLLGLHKVVQASNNTKFALTCCPSGIFERQFCKGNLNVKNHIFPGNIPLVKLKNGETKISVWWDRGLGNKPDEDFWGRCHEFCTLVSPPSPVPFHPRGLSRRRHFSHVDQLSDSGGRNYHCQTGSQTKHWRHCQWKRYWAGGSPVCVTVCSRSCEGGGARSARCSARLGTNSTRAGRSTPFEDADSAPEVARRRRQVTVDDTCNWTPFLRPLEALSRSLSGHKVPGFLLSCMSL